MARLDPEAKDAKVSSTQPPGEFTRLFGTPPTPACENFGKTASPPRAADPSEAPTAEILVPAAIAKAGASAPTVPPDMPLPAGAAPGSSTATFDHHVNTAAGQTPSAEAERRATIAPSERSRTTPAAQVKRPASDFSKMFANVTRHDFPAPAREIASVAPAKPPEERKRVPGAFTQLFNSMTKESSEAAGPSSPTSSPETVKPDTPADITVADQPTMRAAVSPEKEAGGAKAMGEFTKLFSAAAGPVAGGAKETAAFTKLPKAAPVEPEIPLQKEELGNAFGAPPTPQVHSAPPGRQAGEFTKFFAAAEPTPSPAVSSPAVDKQQGAFTKLFSASATTPAAPPPTSAEPKEVGAFTKLFSTSAAAPEAPREPVSAQRDDPFVATANSPAAPQTPMPAGMPFASPGEPFAPTASVPAGKTSSAATQIFTHPGANTPPPPPGPAGPSAFTRIVSVPQATPPPAPPAATPGLTPPASVPQVAAVQMPPMQMPYMQAPGMQVPGMQVPGMQVPGVQMPGVQTPGVQMPQAQMPPVQAPQPAAPVPAGQVNWMPLIIGINVLFLAVIIVILIFALKK